MENVFQAIRIKAPYQGEKNKDENIHKRNFG